jgi:hypothetical protein
MALAILEFNTIEKGQAKFTIDTGTNEFYYFKIGRSERERSGIKWVDEVVTKTAVQKNEKSISLFNSSKECAISLKGIKNDPCYVQLFSFKNKEGKSPAFSNVIKIPMGLNEIEEPDVFSLSTSITEKSMTMNRFNTHRTIPHTLPNYSQQESFEDILSGIVRIAGPIVMGLLTGTQNNTAGATAGSAPASAPPLGMLNTILDALLRGATAPVAASGAAVPASPALPAVMPSAARSLSMSVNNKNRFTNSPTSFSQPFIFGIDDAIIASLAGPVLQLLPQILNSVNQAKLQNKQANNKLVTDLVAETNRRMMLQQLLQNQQAAGASAPAGGINMEQLLQLLQQVPAADPATAPVAVAPVAPVRAASTTQSLVYNNMYVSVLSTKTILSFENAAAILFNGKEQMVYSKNADIKLKLKLNVVAPAPTTPLPKAIIRIAWKDSKNNTIFEKVIKQKNILPNTIIEVSITALELRGIPANIPLQVIAEMKWQTSQNKEVKTLGNVEMVLTENAFIKEQGKALVEEKELTDMNVYRAFWNKIWESPVLDKISSETTGGKKYNWELNADLKYSFVLSPDHTSNGLMETKKLIAQKDPESLSEKTEGRMKAGIELSVGELNKLCSLWDKQTPLAPEKLNAFKTVSFATTNANEFIFTVKLKGKASDRGMVWVVPVFKLINFTLGNVKTINDCGQVTEVTDEQVQFPLPVSARILGLKTA